MASIVWGSPRLCAYLLLLVALGLPTQLALAGDKAPGLVPVDKDPELLAKVMAAVEKGREFLKAEQKDSGHWDGVWVHTDAPFTYLWGETALCLYALLRSDEPKDSPVVQKGFQYLRKKPFVKNYEVSCLLLALSSRGMKDTVEERIRDCQKAGRAKIRLSRSDRAWMEECVRYLLKHREASWRQFGSGTGMGDAIPDSWHYPGPKGTPTDHSNTAFAVLALKAARRCGFKIPPQVWNLLVKHFIAVQEKVGPQVRRIVCVRKKKTGLLSLKKTAQQDQARGWCYGAGELPRAGGDKIKGTTGSMTAACLAGLAMAMAEQPGRSLTPGIRKKAQAALWDGLAWLDLYWTLDVNPQHAEKYWLYYYIYSLERVAIVTRTHTLGMRDWYREGVQWLLNKQNDDGSWDELNCPGPLYNTAFALLFLTKSTAALGGMTLR